MCSLTSTCRKETYVHSIRISIRIKRVYTYTEVRPVCIQRKKKYILRHMHIRNALCMTQRDRSVFNRCQTCIHIYLCARCVCIERDIGKAHLHMHICSYVHMYPLTEDTRLQIFGSPDLSSFPGHSLSDGDSVYSRENLFRILGTPETRCWTPVAGSNVLEEKVS